MTTMTGVVVRHLHRGARFPQISSAHGVQQATERLFLLVITTTQPHRFFSRGTFIKRTGLMAHLTSRHKTRRGGLRYHMRRRGGVDCLLCCRLRLCSLRGCCFSSRRLSRLDLGENGRGMTCCFNIHNQTNVLVFFFIGRDKELFCTTPTLT